MTEEYNKEQLITACGLCFFLGILLMTIFVHSEITDEWVRDETLNNRTQEAYLQGIIDVANFTTLTGNFTYIYNNSIQNQGVQDYCLQLLNTNTGGK